MYKKKSVIMVNNVNKYIYDLNKNIIQITTINSYISLLGTTTVMFFGT